MTPEGERRFDAQAGRALWVFVAALLLLATLARFLLAALW